MEESPSPATTSFTPSTQTQTDNHTHLGNLRASSCYPAFRAFIAVFTIAGYIVSAIFALVGFFSGSTFGVLASLIGAVIIALLVKVSAEASLMIADIADATIDSTSRNAP
ncbi:hypothetical protein OK348_14225 [Flavobacterium sp. MXW15]|uniref:DUF4282 domain-containing protein n=1 Tax=Xanthomonas chitinilytica TaxID=2989819 RepID=A0ABT3JYJ4_9XANT|nr:hypothetical protein [Xanthomonas sp. H13-6]MCW4455944.1 hypothetical protein [Flavobacterium sp. MXW15]MCW4473543.1 hypothetical protein [Xanthomonas sp. H13-6]